MEGNFENVDAHIYFLVVYIVYGPMVGMLIKTVENYETGWGYNSCCYGPQSPSFPHKLATALKNKIHTLHSAIHVYHRCLTINTVITLNLIVSNRLYFLEYTSS